MSGSGIICIRLRRRHRSQNGSAKEWITEEIISGEEGGIRWKNWVRGSAADGRHRPAVPPQSSPASLGGCGGTPRPEPAADSDE